MRHLLSLSSPQIISLQLSLQTFPLYFFFQMTSSSHYHYHKDDDVEFESLFEELLEIPDIILEPKERKNVFYREKTGRRPQQTLE